MTAWVLVMRGGDCFSGELYSLLELSITFSPPPHPNRIITEKHEANIRIETSAGKAEPAVRDIFGSLRRISPLIRLYCARGADTGLCE